jgi:hypothetical protein
MRSGNTASAPVVMHTSISLNGSHLRSTLIRVLEYTRSNFRTPCISTVCNGAGIAFYSYLLGIMSHTRIFITFSNISLYHRKLSSTAGPSRRHFHRTVCRHHGTCTVTKVAAWRSVCSAATSSLRTLQRHAGRDKLSDASDEYPVSVLRNIQE